MIAYDNPNNETFFSQIDAGRDVEDIFKNVCDLFHSSVVQLCTKKSNDELEPGFFFVSPVKFISSQ